MPSDMAARTAVPEWGAVGRSTAGEAAAYGGGSFTCLPSFPYHYKRDRLRIVAARMRQPAAKVFRLTSWPVRTSLALRCGCNIGEMSRKVPVKCAIAGCHRRLKLTLAQHEELKRVGRENNATAGAVCPAHVKAAFNFEFDDIDVDVPLSELLVEASKDTPRWRVMLTPLPGATEEPDGQSTAGRGDRVI